MHVRLIAMTCGWLTVNKGIFLEGEELTARLATVDVDTSNIDYLINSHLHFDHAGGNNQVPNASLVIQRREWEAAHDADLIESNAYLPYDYDNGHDLIAVDGEYDLFGDGSVVCLPTYGHTPGHQALKVRVATGEIVLAGDACYLRRTLEELHLPLVVHDREAMIASIRRLRRLRDRGARVFFGHDPEFWRTVPQAPTAIGEARAHTDGR